MICKWSSLSFECPDHISFGSLLLARYMIEYSSKEIQIASSLFSLLLDIMFKDIQNKRRAMTSAPYMRVRVSTVDLLNKVACLVTKVNNMFNMNSSRSILVSQRRSSVLSLPLQ